MNLEQLKKNIGQLLQLEPIACSLNQFEEELERINDDWLLRDITTDYLIIQNIRTAHIIKLGKDHVHHYTSNPNRVQGNAKFGFITLHVQIFLKGADAFIRPNSRPGEPVDPIRKPKNNNFYHSSESFFLSGGALHVLNELSKHGGHWNGTALQFNKFAADTIYGQDFSELMASSLVDFYSMLMVSDYIAITSIADIGNLPDGTPHTIINIMLTPKAYEAIK